MFNYRKALVLPAVVAFAAAAVSLSALADNATRGAAVGRPAPMFTLQDQGGKSVSLADFKGKIVVLEWINKDCPFVQRHLKARTIDALATKYKGNDVAFLAIDSTSSHNTADRQKTSTENGTTVLDDSQGKVGMTYGAKTTPHMFVISKEGVLAYQGALDNDPDGNKADRVNYVAKAVDELLAGKSVSTSETKSYGCGVKYPK
jgi:peroxiredoxin